MGNRVEKGALGGVRCRIDCLMRFLTICLFPIILLCDFSFMEQYVTLEIKIFFGFNREYSVFFSNKQKFLALYTSRDHICDDSHQSNMSYINVNRPILSYN